MASYKVEYIRPTVYLDNAGFAVTGYQVRITIFPWNEARDLNVPDTAPETIHPKAVEEISKRAALDELTGIEVELPT